MEIDLKNYLPFIQDKINGNKNFIVEYNELKKEINFYKNRRFFSKKNIGRIKINNEKIYLILNRNNSKLSPEIFNEYNLLIFLDKSIKEILSN